MNNLSATLKNFIDPETGIRPFADAKITPQANGVLINLPFAADLALAKWQEALAMQIPDLPPLSFTRQIVAHKVQGALKPLTGVKNIIAVASGKGGVGKSTVAVNLAIALKQQGAQVGLLDADIYGPSQARMLGGAERPVTRDGKTMEPNRRYGLQTLSMGDLVEEDTAMVWRGPMVTQTLIQLLNECHWQDLDYLIIDLPPGTGDTQLTLAQQIPVTGAVIVSTPQDIALLDAKKAKTMFDKVSIATLGIIENMSTFICPHCGEKTPIFGEHGAAKLAATYHLPLLGEIPLDIRLREDSDAGIPLTEHAPRCDIALEYQKIAYRLGAAIAAREVNYSQKFPNIVVEK